MIATEGDERVTQYFRFSWVVEEVDFWECFVNRACDSRHVQECALVTSFYARVAFTGVEVDDFVPALIRAFLPACSRAHFVRRSVFFQIRIRDNDRESRC